MRQTLHSGQGPGRGAIERRYEGFPVGAVKTQSVGWFGDGGSGGNLDFYCCRTHLHSHNAAQVCDGSQKQIGASAKSFLYCGLRMMQTRSMLNVLGGITSSCA